MKGYCEKVRNKYEEQYYQQGFKSGMRKVVEFIRAERKCRHIDDVLYYPVYEKALETKEKEWGL